MSRQYTQEVFNRQTGELVEVDLGEWMTLTEFTDAMGVGMKLGRAVLLEIGLIGVEGGRFRLKREHEASGLGRRLKAKKSKFPFDVLSPAGQAYATARWSDALAAVETARSAEDQTPTVMAALNDFRKQRSDRLTTQMEVCWIIDHFEGVSTRTIARVLNVTEAIVFKWSSVRSRQLKTASELKKLVFPLQKDGLLSG
jgi:hypothetical protein